MLRRWNAMEVWGRRMLDAPPTTAKSMRPLVRSAMASLKAISAEEQAAKQ